MTLDLYCNFCPHSVKFHDDRGCLETGCSCTQHLGPGLVFETEQEPKYDPINYPYHYQTDKGIEAIDVIEAFNLPHHLACVVKYILRHQNKGGLEDLKKAKWYLDRWIEREETRQ